MLAAQSGQVDTVTALLDAHADVNAVETTHGQSALMFAAAYDRAEVVRLLIARGATADLTSKVVDLAALTDPGDGDGRPPEPQPGAGRRAEPRRAGGGRGRRPADAAADRPPAWPARLGPSATTSSSARKAGSRRCTSPPGRARRRRCGRWSTPAPT